MKNYKELEKSELMEVNGGGIWLILAAIAFIGGVIFGVTENPDVVE